MTKRAYKFHIGFVDGRVITWTGLSRATARAMFKATEQNTHLLSGWGWCLEEKPTP